MPVVRKRKKFNPEGTGYDLISAQHYGLKPKAGHWPSRVPETGLILKGMKHKTINLTLGAEKRLGYKIVKKGTRYYSVKKK